MLYKHLDSDGLKEAAFVSAYGILLLCAHLKNEQFYYLLCMIVLLNLFFTDIGMIGDETSKKQMVSVIGLILARLLLLLSLDELLNIFASVIKNYYSAAYVVFITLFTYGFILMGANLKGKIASSEKSDPANDKPRDGKIGGRALNRIKFQLVLGVRRGDVSDNSGCYSFKVSKPFMKKQKISAMIHIILLCMLSILMSFAYSLLVFPINWIAVFMILAVALIYILVLYIIRGKSIISHAVITREQRK